MNELELLNDTGRALDPPAGPSPALRRRVLSAMEAVEPQAARPLRRRRHLAWAAGLAAAAAVAAGTVVVLTGRSTDPSAGPAPITTSPASQPAGSGSAAPATTMPAADARQLLRAAAVVARTGPTPRPDQFLHITSISVRGDRAMNREIWKSVDGTRASYSSNAPAAYLAGCKDGVLVGKDDQPMDRQGPGTDAPCTPRPGYRLDLPTTLAGMRQRLQATGLLGLVTDVFMQPTPNLLPPSTEAVLFEALAELPEVTLVQPVTDAAGRPSLAVSWNHSGSTVRLLFDPATHTYRSVQIIEPGKQAPSLEDTTVRYEIADAIPSPLPPPSDPSSRPPR
jgi:hypothetical protein